MKNIPDRNPCDKFTPDACKWRRSGCDRRSTSLFDSNGITEKRSEKNRRKDWLAVVSKVIYPKYDIQ
jgi:hypothetical protein